MKIASLEDDAAQGRLIKDTLEASGYDCTLFARGHDLLTVLPKSQPFDLILLDWEVPDISGLDVLHWISTTLGYSVPVMFITSRTDESALVVGLGAGVGGDLATPIRRR